MITLTVTLILFNSINSTAGRSITSARRGSAASTAFPESRRSTCLSAATSRSISRACSTCRRRSLIVAYLGLRLLLASRFGRVIVGIRENERRAELLGYDPRACKLATFVIGGALAGFAGCLFANWGAFVSPTIFGLAQSAQIIIWVIVGGRGTLIGPILGCVGIQWLTAALGANAADGGDRPCGAARQRAADPRRDADRLRAPRAEGLRCRSRWRDLRARAADPERRRRDERRRCSRPSISACASAACRR